MLHDEQNHRLIKELFDYFQSIGFEIRGVRGEMAFPQPPFVQNDGYGDQQRKMPDIFAYDTCSR
ncbi:MAG: hypothetical protein HY960_11430 [Ignavibacteriae bacterium]|nr:hypothetical protein [Ignavibacteriota bacterium]